MKILSWNVRGLWNPRIIRRLRHVLKLQNPQVVYLMETKICKSQIERRHIDVIIEEVEEGNRTESWNLLRRLGEFKEFSWMVCGDFNEILYGFEKKGGLPREEGRMEAFHKVLEDCNLVDVGYTGNWFTWEWGNLPGTNIQERLNRGVATEEWLSLFPNFQLQHLTHTFLDHCPLLISTKKKKKREKERRSRSFKFEAWWVMEESFLNAVKNIWENSTGDLLSKLECTIRGLERWAGQIKYNRKEKSGQVNGS
ncbi:reverse transcriptase [Gossypium australe]|uniref:Reverse transcriptase n=1 Tax=Gossypium australe TaxID=47621 RepID=A0A5B6V7S8_9ROSI|nr:reverse transcriptase [Gossypium australe]